MAGRDEAFVNVAPVPVVRDVAPSRFQAAQEFLLAVFAEEPPLSCTARPAMPQDVHCLRPGQFVEEPAAAGVHQHEMALRFEQESAHLFFEGKVPHSMAGKKCVHIAGRTIQHDVNVAFPSRSLLFFRRFLWNRIYMCNMGVRGLANSECDSTVHPLTGRPAEIALVNLRLFGHFPDREASVEKVEGFDPVLSPFPATTCPRGLVGNGAGNRARPRRSA